MTDSLATASGKAGLAPGSLIHVGEVLQPVTRMTLIDYSKESMVEMEIQSLEQILQYKDSDTVTWVIIEGLTDVSIVERIGAMFGIHHLVLEDILNTHQRPKFEEYDDHLFIVLKGLISAQNKFTVGYEQISLLVLKNFVFAFKEKQDDLFSPLLQRLRTSKGRFRSLGSDYLAYSILDTIVDQNFVLLDDLDVAL